MRASRIVALIAAVALLTAIPAAAQGKGKGHGHGKGKPQAESRYQMTEDGWQRYDRYDMRVYGPREGVPPGWSKGNKTGWRDCGLPPGQAKKYGCNSYVHEGRRYYYYQDEVGRIIVRRPRIEIHAVIR